MLPVRDVRRVMVCVRVQAQAYALGVNQQAAIYGGPVSAGDGGVLLDSQGAPIGVVSCPLPPAAGLLGLVLTMIHTQEALACTTCSFQLGQIHQDIPS